MSLGLATFQLFRVCFTLYFLQVVMLCAYTLLSKHLRDTIRSLRSVQALHGIRMIQ